MSEPRPHEIERHPGPRRLVPALLWSLGICGIFYTFTLPNNPQFDRMDIWRRLPELLLANVLPAPNDSAALPSGWQYLPQRFDLIVVAAFILAGAWGLGHLLLRLISPPRPARGAERTVFAFGLGLSGLSLITLGCGLAGWLSRPLLGGGLALLIGTETALRIAQWRKGRRGPPGPGEREGTENRGRTARDKLLVPCLLAVAPFLLAMILGAMLPPTDFDVKEYHLQGPKEFYQNGRITFLPHNVYTSFPFLTEMLSLLAMVLRDDWYRGALAGKAVLASFAPLTGLALYAAGRRWFSPRVGLLAATVYLTTPWIYRISIIAYAEGGLTFYLFAALLATMLALSPPPSAARKTEPSRGIRSLSLFLIAGLLAGSAMACKYPALVSVVLPLGLVVCAATLRRNEYRTRTPSGGSETPQRSFDSRLGKLGPPVVFAVGVLLTAGPWLIKNAVETGNPVYPLAYSVFGGRDWSPDLNARWRDAHSPPDYDLSRIPWWMVDVSLRNDWLSPLLYALAPLALLGSRFLGRHRNRAVTVRLLWLYVGFLFLTWWGLTHRLDRFWVPMLPVVSLLAGIGADWTAERSWRFACAGLMAAALLFNLGFVTSSLCGFNAYLADLDAARRTAESTAPGIAVLNRHLPEGAKVLCVGEAQVFDARFPLVYNTVFDESILKQWCAPEKPGVPAAELPLRPPDDIRAQLEAEGITHVFVNWGEILRYRTTYGYTDFVTPQRFTELQRRGILGPPQTLGERETDRLSARVQQEIERWAPTLRRTAGGQDRVITLQVFPVRTRTGRP